MLFTQSKTIVPRNIENTGNYSTPEIQLRFTKNEHFWNFNILIRTYLTSLVVKSYLVCRKNSLCGETATLKNSICGAIINKIGV